MTATTSETKPTVNLIDHPLILHKLSLMRRKDTSTSAFRALLEEISMLLGYELTRDLPVEMQDVRVHVSQLANSIQDGLAVSQTDQQIVIRRLSFARAHQ